MEIKKDLLGKGAKIHVDEIAVAPGLLLGGAVIVESGENSNGGYIRFGDGSQICNFSTEVSHNNDFTSVAVQGLTLYRHNTITDWQFPASFASPPTIVGNAVQRLTTWRDMSFIGPLEPSKTKVNFAILSLMYTKDATLEYKLIAIGRWK